VFVN